MPSLRTYFGERAARLSDCADLRLTEENDVTWLRLIPYRPEAVGVVLYLGSGDYGTVKLDDQAAVPAELGEDVRLDLRAIEHVIDTAVEGRATAFHIGRGGCVEEWNDGIVSRSWRNAVPWPGWRRRAQRLDFRPYR